MLRLLAASLLTVLSTAPTRAQSSATYNVSFDATWSAQTHPDGFPANPHFSGLVGATHTAETSLWSSGETASPGIESMAETGAKTTLLAEANALVGSGVEAALSGGGIGTSPGSVSMEVTASESHAHVSLVSMLAPSPDWFVGVDGLALRDGNGWIQEIVVPLHLYDAGTDSGPDYTSADDDTSPQAAIVEIDEAPFHDGTAPIPVGTLTLTLQATTAGEAVLNHLGEATLAPNPTRGVATVALARAPQGRIEVRVLDALGRVVATLATSRAQTIRFDTTGWAPGIYSVRIETERERVVRRLVVAR